jgi:hypothetical protein
MPNWKKVITSGSDAALNSLLVTNSFTASGLIYPSTDGTTGQVVTTDGAGNLSFSNVENTTITIKNVSGVTIQKGTPCYITGSGTSGNLAGVFPADAANPLRMPAGVIAGETLTAGSEGIGLINGFIGNVNTSAFGAGDTIYVAVGGGYTNVRPTGSSILVQKLGNVEKSHPSNGSGVINGPGYYNDLPNIQAGYTWVGNSNGVAVAIATSSIQNVVSSSYALSASHASSTAAVAGTTNYVSKFTSGTTIGDSLIFDNGTNVGIGIATPGAKLHIAGAEQILDDGVNGRLTFGVTSGQNDIYSTTTSFGSYQNLRYTANDHIFRNAGTEAMRLTGGNVGIGTTNPGYKLTVAPLATFGNAEDGNINIIASPSGGTYSDTTVGGIVFGDQTLTNGYLGRLAVIQNNPSLSTLSHMRFYTNSGGGNSTTLERMRITGAGDVGIGTTNPVSYGGLVSLTIGDNSASKIGLLKFRSDYNSGNGAEIWQDSAGLLRINTNSGTIAMVATAGGDIGINTTTPSQKFQVNGRTLVDQFQYTKAINYTSGDLDTLTLAGFYDGSGMTNAPNSGWFYVTIEKHSDGTTQWVHQTATSFGSGNTPNEVYTRVRVGSTWGAWKQLGDAASISGNTNYIPKFTSGTAIGNSIIYEDSSKIGIGTTVPQTKLEVRGSQNNTIAPANGVAKFVGGDAGIFVGTLAGTPSYGSWLQAMRESDGLVFNMFLQPNGGSVGIGTTGPSAKLHIAADALGTSSGDSVLNSIHFNSNGNSEELEIKSVRTSAGSDWTTAGKRIQMRIDSTYMGYIQFNGTNNQAGISFGTGTTTSGPGNVAERMIIDSSGNVGIGTGPATKLHVNGTVLTTSTLNSAAGSYTIDHPGVNTWKIGITDANTSTLHIGNDTGGSFANKAINITNAGNVGIGNTNPGAKLDISGDLYVRPGAGTYTNVLAPYSGDLTIALGGSGNDLIVSGGNVGIGTTSPDDKLDVEGYIRMSGTSNASAILGGVQSSWGGDIQYPTLYGTSADRWVMHINPHISYVQNGANGYSGTTNGATVRFASDTAATTYWDLGVGVNSVGTDKYSIGRAGSSLLAIDNAGNVGIGVTSPNGKLQVNGNAYFGTFLNTDIRYSFVSSGALSSYHTYIDNTNSSGGTYGLGVNSNNTSNNGYILGLSSGGTERMIVRNDGNVGIGTSLLGSYRLNVSGDTNIIGTLTATVKSFIIDHPTKENKKLQYGVLEGPEHSVYVRGKLTNTNVIQLPDYWHALVHEDSITVNLTAIGKPQEIWVEEITDTYITVGSLAENINCFYAVFAERKDIDKLVTEFDKE